MRASLLALLVAAVGCGDNDHLCGVGTTYEAAKNACVPVSGCGPGTMLDPATNACVAVCTDGTKLILTGDNIITNRLLLQIWDATPLPEEAPAKK